MRRKLLTDRKAAEEFVAKLERGDLYFFEFDNDGRKVDTTDLLVALLKNRIAMMNYTLQQTGARAMPVGFGRDLV